MIIATCPYCQTDNNILFRVESLILIAQGETDCKCEKCNETFEIYQGPEKYEVRKKNYDEREGNMERK